MMKLRTGYHLTIFFVNFINMFLFSQVFSIDKEIILKKIEKLTFEETDDLNNFFKICFYKSTFGYTIFGEKPMSLDVIDVERPPLDNPIYKENILLQLDYRRKQGWDVWKKYFQDVYLEDFSIISYQNSYPGSIDIAIINHRLFLNVIDNNLAEFQEVLKQKINSIEILKEYIKGEGEVFDLINNHDGLLGILLGYGKENSWKYVKGEKLSPSFDPSNINFKDLSNILPPFFGVSKESRESEQIVESYAKQRKKINEIYQKENFLEIVLLKLFCSETK